MSKKILAALLAVLMVLTIMPMTAFAAGFDDTDGHWGQASIDRWAQAGILSGKGNGKFDPNGSMTRAEFAQMLVNMMGYTQKAGNVFIDVPEGAWYADAMLKLLDAGVLQGSGGNANPNGKITREMTAVMLCRAFGIKASPNATLAFQDSASVSSWARDAVAALAERGMMNGVGNNTAAPKRNINRASVAQLADNMIAEYVTEDKTITGKVDGIILVAGSATVTLSDATVEAPVIVAPKAEEATVALAGETTVESVAVAAEGAAVTVADSAQVGAVSVEAPSATAEIAGKADAVTVAEAAESAAVTVAETAEVGAIAVEAPSATAEIAGNAGTVTVAESAESATVTVAKTAEVTSVSVEAPKATTEIAGKAESVTVAGTAESAKVNVAGTVGTVTTEAANTDLKVDGKADSVTVAGENAKVDVAGTVGTVSTEAANTNVSVSGTVSKVDVAEGASDTTITAGSGAKVENVVTNGGNTTVSGSGTVSNVTAGENATGTTVTTGGTKVENNSGESVSTGKGEIASGETGTTPSTGGSTPSTGGGTTTPPVVTDSSVTEAVFHDTRKAEGKVAGKDYVAEDALKVGYSVSSQVVDGVTEVTVNHLNIWQHQNGDNPQTLGYWTGYAIKAPEGATKFKYIKAANTTTEPSTVVDTLEDIDQKGTGGVAVYYNVGDTADTAKVYFGVQWLIPGEDNSNTEYTATKWYHVNWNVSCRPIVSNAQAHVVTTVADVSKLNLPGDSLDALFADDLRDQVNDSNKALLPEGPWLLVVYDRNAAGIALKATKDGQELTTSAIPKSAETIGTGRVQAWAMSPSDGDRSDRLWNHSEIASATFSGTYGVNFTLTGSEAVAATPVSYEHANETTYTVTFDGADVPAQTVKSGNKPIKPADPTKDGYYFVGWYKEAAFKTAWNFESDPVTENTTLYAKFLEIGEQAAAFRGDGPATGVTGTNYSYSDAYNAAGIGYTDGNVTVDGATMLSWFNAKGEDGSDKTNAEAITALTHKINNIDYLFVGLQYKKPDGATKVAVADTVADLRNATAEDLSENTATTIYNEQRIEYFGAVKLNGDKLEFLADKTTPPWTSYVMWLDSSNNVLAVNKLTVGRKTTVPEVTLTVGNGATVKVPYNKDIGEENLAAIMNAAAVKENYTVKAVKDGSAEVTANTQFTKNTTLTVVYEAKATFAEGTDLTEDKKFGAVKVADFQEAIHLPNFEWKSAKNRYETTVGGYLTKRTFKEFSSVEAEQSGYYIFLKLTIPKELKETAKITYNNTVMTADDYDADGNLTMITRLEEKDMVETKGIKVDVDWDGEGENVPTTYVVKFAGLKAKPSSSTGSES